jgi:hypothetical protein
MACPPVVFQNVDANAWECLKQKATAYAQKNNFPLPALDPTGSVSHSGFSANWAYDGGAKTFTVTCTGHPFFVSCGFVNGHVQSGIAGTGCIPGVSPSP